MSESMERADHNIWCFMFWLTVVTLADWSAKFTNVSKVVATTPVEATGVDIHDCFGDSAAKNMSTCMPTSGDVLTK